MKENQGQRIDELFEQFKQHVNDELASGKETQYLLLAMAFFRSHLPKEPNKLYSAENFKQVGETCPDCKAELVRECNFCHNCGQSIRRG